MRMQDIQTSFMKYKQTNRDFETFLALQKIKTLQDIFVK